MQVGPDNRREFEFAIRELELRRREEALRRAELAAALPRVPAAYFKPARNDEESWWEKQLGRI
ncbi:MAG TPA: hypothetical protein VGL76_01115 [Gaiellaceae bacterium]|jgi:hypothetical protein